MKRFCTATLTLLIVATVNLGQSQSRDDQFREIQARRLELQKLEREFLAPSAEDKATYAAYLGHKDMGLVRLLPRSANDLKSPELRTVRGGGAYYSFTRLTHEYGNSSDISLEQGHFSVGFAGANYGMMTNLGDVPLETVSLENPQSQFLAAYKVPGEEPSARSEARRFSTGADEDGVSYKNRLPVELRSTYLLRSINYSGADVLVAFKVVRKDADGSVVLLWKLLKHYPVPQLARVQ